MSDERKPLFVECKACGERWKIATLPIGMREVVKATKTACPNCAKSWQAQIKALSRNFYLGCYATEEAAARAYDAAAKEKHGEFASLNFSDGEVAA